MTTTTTPTLKHGDHFRIGYTEFRVWTLAGFYAAQLRESADNFERYGWNPTCAADLVSFEAYRAEQRRRGSADMGASAQAAVLVGDRAEGARRAEAFHALPEFHWGDSVMLLVIEPRSGSHFNDSAVREHTLQPHGRTNRDHVTFVPVAAPAPAPADDDVSSGYKPEGAALYTGAPGSGSIRRRSVKAQPRTGRR